MATIATIPAPAPVQSHGFSFKSVGHFFAKAWKAITEEATEIEPVVETVETAVDPSLVTPTQLAFASLGELSSLLNTGEEAVKQKLLNAGLDINVITAIEALLKSKPDLASIAKALGTPAPAPATPAA